MSEIRNSVCVCLLLVMLSAAGAAQAFDIYNGAPGLDLPVLKKHRSVKMRALWPAEPAEPDFGVIDADHVESFVAQLPPDRTYEFDLEGNPARADLGLDLWHYEASPATAVALREEMMGIIRAARPDLNIGIWSIPDHVHQLQNNPSDRALALAIVQREVQYRRVTRFSDTIYIHAYWRAAEPDDFDALTQWKKEVRLKVNLAESFHGQTPRVYIWHRGFKLLDNTLSPELFEAMLRFLRDEGLDAVFWAQQSDRYFPDWLKALLAEYDASN
jgi:hypothetical protein